MAGGGAQKQNQQGLNPQLAAVLAQTAGAGGNAGTPQLQRALGAQPGSYLPLAAQMMGVGAQPQMTPPPQRPMGGQMAPPPGMPSPPVQGGQPPGAPGQQGQLTPAMINAILARQSGLLGGGQQY
jgi:hypothetical protein